MKGRSYWAAPVFFRLIESWFFCSRAHLATPRWATDVVAQTAG
jgi:hypothetical protein